jgi:C1A family cysteine protease
MKLLLFFALGHFSVSAFATLPHRYIELLKFVQKAPDQGETNACWFVASTGAMELLLNQKDHIIRPKVNGKNDLSESFLIWQSDYYDPGHKKRHFIEEVVLRFNHGEAIHQKFWPFNAYDEDGQVNMDVWNIHPQFELLPRMKIPSIKTQLLFSRGKKYSTYVLESKDIQTMKEALVKHRSPLIVNYNDEGFWHVVLIVGYHDKKRGRCYDLEPSECKGTGSFYVRDSNGNKYESRSYEWFLRKGNAAAVVELE